MIKGTKVWVIDDEVSDERVGTVISNGTYQGAPTPRLCYRVEFRDEDRDEDDDTKTYVESVYAENMRPQINYSIGIGDVVTVYDKHEIYAGFIGTVKYKSYNDCEVLFDGYSRTVKISLDELSLADNRSVLERWFNQTSF